MKVAVFVALLAVLAMGAPKVMYDLSQPTKALFQQYVQEHGLELAPRELHHRLRVFETNVAKMRALNEEARKLGRNTRFGVNKFAHLTEKEFQQRYLNAKMPSTWRPSSEADFAPLASAAEIAGLPDSIDWRQHTPPVVTPVKNQGDCGSCWTFSTTGNVEGQWALAGHRLVSLSEQNLVDCDHTCLNGTCDAGCDGGLMQNAFTWVIKNGGLMSEADYPYQGVDGDCQFDASKVVASITNYTFVAKTADQMAAFLVKNGPIAIAADATMWQFYLGGVWYFPCGTTLDHGILIVGYGTEVDMFGQNMPYWIVKNSWGADWGEDGYILVERGNDRCGLQEYPISALIKK